MAHTKGRRTTTFIVRLWQDDGEENSRPWRGQIEHVQTGEKEYVRDMTQVIAFIEGHFRDRAHEAGGRGIR
jgi:hypothetical protein